MPLSQRSTVRPGRRADGESPLATGEIPARREDPEKSGDLNKRSAERQQMLESLQAALDKRIRVVNE